MPALIIGDTEGIAKGLRLARDGNGAGIDARFDLVLTYDYENLSGSIQDKSRTLKNLLREAGLHEHDQKRLTLLVHSMGGLVARWLIEREGGNRFIDHLVITAGLENDFAGERTEVIYLNTLLPDAEAGFPFDYEDHISDHLPVVTLIPWVDY